MKSYTLFAVPLLLAGLAACNGTPANGLIPYSTYQLEQLTKATPTGSSFTQFLTADYRTFAQGEKDEYDWNAQKIFATKGLAAADGTAVPPERIEDWSFSSGDAAAVGDLTAARARLVTMLGGDAPTRFPEWAATAQTKFDCWLHEQHEGWETDEIAACRAAFIKAMEQINAPVKAAEAPAPAPAAAPAKMAPAAYIVFFDFDKSDLKPEARRIIASAAQAIKAGHGIKIQITGFTDTMGTVPYNIKLSYRRGNSVEQELVRDGVPAGSIGVDGKGKGDLLVPTPDEVREPKNRRATIELMGQ
jgi:OOP family OmpA-OmpF porin